MSRFKMPYDKVSAKAIMEKFPDKAYSLGCKEVFQEAVNLLHGPEFRVTVDFSKRMQFSCQICNREMNSEKAMVEHNLSGGHQKNLEKKNREAGQMNYYAQAANYAKDSIQHKLLCSIVKPLGLQLVEEYINRKGNIYYKCNLCCSHGKLETMYNHTIGSKHTEKYIKTSCILQNSVLTPNEREEIRKNIIKVDGVNVNAIKTIKGDNYYPYMWESEARTSRLYNEKFKKERRSSSPDPGPSRRRHSSRSSSEEKKDSRSRNKRSTSRTSRYSRSPGWYRSKSSRKGNRRHSRSSSSSSDDSRLSRSLSPISRPTVKTEPVEDVNTKPLLARGVDLDQYRNRSPPPLSRVKLEPSSPSHDSVRGAVVPIPPPPPHIIPETKDKETKSEVDGDLNELMLMMNNIIKSEAENISDAVPVCLEDVETIIEGMNATAEALRQLSINALAEGGPSMPQARKDLLNFQKEKTEKTLSYIQKWYRPTYEAMRRNLSEKCK